MIFAVEALDSGDNDSIRDSDSSTDESDEDHYISGSEFTDSDVDSDFATIRSPYREKSKPQILSRGRNYTGERSVLKNRGGTNSKLSHQDTSDDDDHDYLRGAKSDEGYVGAEHGTTFSETHSPHKELANKTFVKSFDKGNIQPRRISTKMISSTPSQCVQKSAAVLCTDVNNNEPLLLQSESNHFGISSFGEKPVHSFKHATHSDVKLSKSTNVTSADQQHRPILQCRASKAASPLTHFQEFEQVRPLLLPSSPIPEVSGNDRDNTLRDYRLHQSSSDIMHRETHSDTSSRVSFKKSPSGEIKNGASYTSAPTPTPRPTSCNTRWQTPKSYHLSSQQFEDILMSPAPLDPELEKLLMGDQKPVKTEKHTKAGISGILGCVRDETPARAMSIPAKVLKGHTLISRSNETVPRSVPRQCVMTSCQPTQSVPARRISQHDSPTVVNQKASRHSPKSNKNCLHDNSSSPSHLMRKLAMNSPKVNSEYTFLSSTSSDSVPPHRIPHQNSPTFSNQKKFVHSSNSNKNISTNQFSSPSHLMKKPTMSSPKENSEYTFLSSTSTNSLQAQKMPRQNSPTVLNQKAFRHSPISNENCHKSSSSYLTNKQAMRSPKENSLSSTSGNSLPAQRILHQNSPTFINQKTFRHSVNTNKSFPLHLMGKQPMSSPKEKSDFTLLSSTSGNSLPAQKKPHQNSPTFINEKVFRRSPNSNNNCSTHKSGPPLHLTNKRTISSSNLNNEYTFQSNTSGHSPKENSEITILANTSDLQRSKSTNTRPSAQKKLFKSDRIESTEHSDHKGIRHRNLYTILENSAKTTPSAVLRDVKKQNYAIACSTPKKENPSPLDISWASTIDPGNSEDTNAFDQKEATMIDIGNDSDDSDDDDVTLLEYPSSPFTLGSSSTPDKSDDIKCRTAKGDVENWLSGCKLQSKLPVAQPVEYTRNQSECKGLQTARHTIIQEKRSLVKNKNTSSRSAQKNKLTDNDEQKMCSLKKLRNSSIRSGTHHSSSDHSGAHHSSSDRSGAHHSYFPSDHKNKLSKKDQKRKPKDESFCYGPNNCSKTFCFNCARSGASKLL